MMLHHDPYIGAAVAQRRNRVRSEGWPATIAVLAVPLLASIVLIPLVRPTLLGFLDAPASRHADALRQMALWVAIVVVSSLSLDVYAVLIRGRGREVLSLLPIDPARAVRAELLGVAAARWWMLPAVAVVTTPLLDGHPGEWAVLSLLVAGCTALGLSGSAVAYLAAIELAESPAAAPLLDLLRGHNPRAQAAFLYAPGALLIATGAVLGLAAFALPEAAAGDPIALCRVASPILVAVLAWAVGPRLARRSYFRGTAVLGDIDARYAALEDPREVGRVYLDWAVRWMPGRVRVYALDDLRHGWRTRRSFVTGGWLLALVAAGAGWTEAEAGPFRAMAVANAAAFVVCTVGVLLGTDEPPFLRAWLPPRGREGLVARAFVLALWAAPPTLLAVVAVGLRLGLGAALGVALGGVLAIAVAIALALATGRLRERGLVVYAPLAAIAAAAIAAGMGVP